MSNVIPFKFNDAQVRLLTDESGETWFVGIDVCDRLGYVNASKAMSDHCRGVTKRYPIQDSLGRMQETRVLSEPDTLRLIINSALPAAQEFERWVFEDVLPSIRRTGGYKAPGIGPLPQDRQLSITNREYKAALSMAKASGLKGNQASLAADRAVQKSLGISPLKLIGAEALPTEERLLTATELGRECDLTPREMNSLLEAYGYQEKTRDAKNALVWRPTKVGATFGVWLDTAKAHKGGAPVQQLKWKASIVDHLATRLKTA